MGDSGSLSIGASLACLAIILNVEEYFILLSVPFLIGIVTVVIQVTYFKLTNGKRVFKMAPYHHNLELKKWSEKKIVFFYYSIGIFFLVITLIIFFLVH